MLKKVFTALFAASLIIAPLMADTFNGPTKLKLKVFDDLTVNGPAEFKLVKAKTLYVNGPLRFDELDVTHNSELHGPVNGSKGKFDHLQIRGPFEGDYIIADRLDVNGPVNVSYVAIKHETTINGPLKAYHGTFDDITVSGNAISLEDVTTGAIFIKKSKDEQVLKLIGNTTVNGDITFESGNGIIDIASTAKVNGAVKGAQKKDKG